MSKEGEDCWGKSREEVPARGVHLPAKEGVEEEESEVKPAVEGRKNISGAEKPQPRGSSSGEDAGRDDMYSSPLDSSPEVFFVGLLLVLLASLWTRLHKIAEPDHVA